MCESAGVHAADGRRLPCFELKIAGETTLIRGAVPRPGILMGPNNFQILRCLRNP